MTTTTPNIGFLSPWLPLKKLVDSERILTELRAEDDNADLVIVNTCGFIDSAVQEIIGSNRRSFGRKRQSYRYRLLRCKENQIEEVHLKCLYRPHSYEADVHKYAPKPEYNPYLNVVPKQGVKLTPKHAYVKISEGCDHRCTFVLFHLCAVILTADRSTPFG